MTEKELEKLFKTKLGSASYNYNPAAWKAMENLLDQKATRGGAYFWRSAGAILLFGLLVASATFWQMKPVLHDEVPVTVTMPATNEAITQKDLSAEQPEVDPAVASSPMENNVPGSGAGAMTTGSNDAREEQQEDIAEYTPPSSPVSSPPAGTSTTAAPGILFSEDGIFALRDEEESQLIDLRTKSPHFHTNASNGNIRPAPREVAALKPGLRQGLFLKGGTILNESYNTGDMGVGFHIGFEYQVGIARNLDLSTGLNYSRINKFGIHQEFDSTFYHFSSERIETEITGRQLNYLELPVSLNWRFHPRHQIGFGAYAALMVSASEDVEKRHYRQGNEMTVSRAVDEGKLSPYEDYDLGLGGHYFFMIDQQLELGLEFRYGFTDITRDLEGVYERNHQNLNTRISLRYRII